MPRIDLAYRDVVAGSRARLEKLVRARGAASVRKLYEEAIDTLTRRLAAMKGSRKATSFTAHQMRGYLLQLKAGQTQLSQRLAGGLGEASLKAQTDSIRAVARDVARLEKRYTGAVVDIPLEEAARFQGLIDKRRTSLMRAHETSMARYGKRLVRKMEGQLSQALMVGETPLQAIDRVRVVADVEWWQAERIVRTELAWAANSAAVDSLVELSTELPDMMQRWSEHVDDEAYTPLDDRVGDDSLAMHGQVTTAGGEFVMPPTTRDGRPVAQSLVGQRWSFPPNRPNCRAVVSPWRKDWGIPGWMWKGGRRIPIVGGR